jgi:hypothetical protein
MLGSHDVASSAYGAGFCDLKGCEAFPVTSEDERSFEQQSQQ